MIPALTQITQRPLVRPAYANAETFDAWIAINSTLVETYWRDLTWACGVEFARTQYDIPSPTSAATADKSSSHGQKDDYASTGTAGAGVLWEPR
jgi:hypothetical protein